MVQSIRLTKGQVSHLMIIAIATVLIVTAMTSSWWTRGYVLEGDPGSEANLADTFTLSYGPFNTPNYGPFQFDSVREVAVTVTGVAVVLSGVFALAHNVIRFGVERGRFDVDEDIPVRLAIVAFWLGTFGVLFALLWPFLGTTDTGMFSSTELGSETNSDGEQFFIKSAEFLNVGFFLGIFAFIMYPAYLWVTSDAAREELATTKSTAA